MHVSGEGSLTAGNELAGHVVIDEFTPNAALQALLRGAVPPTVDVERARHARARHALRHEPRLRPCGVARLQADRARRDGQRHPRRRARQRGAVFRGPLTTSRFAADAMATAFAAMLPPNLAASELGMIELAATFTLDAAADTLTVAPLRAEAFGLRMSGDVTARDVTRAATWTGTANVAQFSPQELLQRFGLPPQPTSDPQAFTRATVGDALHGYEGRRGARRPRARARRDDAQRHVRARRASTRRRIASRSTSTPSTPTATCRRRRATRRPAKRRPATSSCRRTTR